MPALASDITSDLSGGFVDGTAPTAFPKNAAAALVNARIQPDSTVQRRPGTQRLHAADLNAATGYGGALFTTAAGVDQLIAIFGAQAFYSADSGVTWSAEVEPGAGVNTCAYNAGAHTITTVMDAGYAGTHTWDLSLVTGSLTMTPVVTGTTVKTCVSTDNAGTFTAGTIKVTVGGILYTQAFTVNKDTTLTALAAQLPVAWRADYYSFATMRVGATNYLFAANGDTTVKRWNGLVWDTLPNAPSGVKYLAVFNGRLWATGHSGVLVQASAIGDPTLWSSPDGLTVQVTTSAGDVPTGLFQIGPHLLVFDRHATSYIDGYGEQTIVVATDGIGFSRSVGCVGFRTAVAVGDNAVCWLSERGVEYYSPTAGIQLLTRRQTQFLLGIDRSELYANPGRMTATYDTIEQNYHLALSTNGARNNRTLVLNILDSVQGQRPGARAAASVDQQLSPSGGSVLLGSSDGAYLDDVGVGGLEGDTDADGYFLPVPNSGSPLGYDASGYLVTVTDDTLPATLFVASSSGRATTVHSLGYDGFVRRHYDVTADDVLSNGTGGTDVTMQVVSRPFLVGRAKQRKRVRVVHVSVVSADAVDVLVAVRGSGVQTPQQTLSFLPTALQQSRRKKAMVHVIADEPQVEAYLTNDAKVELVGISAELLREAVG